MVRLLLGLPFAALVTGVLFVVMYGLVRPGEVSLIPPKEPPVVSIFAVKTDPAPAGREAVIEELQPAPPPPAFTPAGPDRAEGVIVPTPRPELAPTELTFGGGAFAVVPVATMAPQYPARCQASGTEGFAVVRFDVTANGQVVNAEVIDRSHACFEQAALRAIRSWRYQPAIGRTGLTARGVIKRFSFDLNEA